MVCPSGAAVARCQRCLIPDIHLSDGVASRIAASDALEMFCSASSHLSHGYWQLKQFTKLTKKKAESIFFLACLRFVYSVIFSFALSFLAVEPGYYEDGSFGIRIENVVLVVPAKPKVGSQTSSSSWLITLLWLHALDVLSFLFAFADACRLCVAERSESL